MTEAESNILANLVGSFVGVIGAVGVLFLASWWNSSREKQETRDNFFKEIRYVKKMIEGCQDTLTRMIQDLGVGANVYFSYSANSILSVSIAKAYQSGLLFEILSPEQIAKLNTEVLTFFGNFNTTGYNVETHVSQQIEKWRNNQATTQELYSVLVFVKDKAEDAVKLLSDIEKREKKTKKRR